MVKLLQITDLHLLLNAEDSMLGVKTEHSFRQVLDSAIGQHGNFDLILLTGDLAQDPCPESYHRLLETLVPLKTPCLCLPGNHDDFGLMQRILNRDPVTCKKRWQSENWQIIALNSQKKGQASGMIASAEFEYLTRQLVLYPDLYTLIAVHHHCVPCGSSWMDNMMIENSEELLELLTQFPQVKAVTCGHVHQVMRTRRDKVELLATPSTCFQFKPGCTELALDDDKSPAYRIFELHGDGRLESRVESFPSSLDNAKAV